MKNNKAERQAIVEHLVRDTWMRVEHLNHIAQRQPELLIPMARKEIMWPGFISNKRAFNRKNSELMQTIRLGEDSVFSSGEWQPDAASNHGANWVYRWGCGMAKEWRPQITRKNKRKWFNEVWRLILNHLHVMPEWRHRAGS